MWRLCHICHSKFTKISNLKRHFRTEHLGLRFHCSQCPSEFRRKEYLKKHVSKKHPTTEMDNILSIPVSIPLDNFQQSVDEFDLSIFDRELDSPPDSPAYVNPDQDIRSVSMGAQTDICTLTPHREKKHSYAGTSPIISRDRSFQSAPEMSDMATSPHIKWIDYKVIPVENDTESATSSATSTATSPNSTQTWEENPPLEEYFTSKPAEDPIPPTGEDAAPPAPPQEFVPVIIPPEGEYTVDMGLFARIMLARK